MAGEVVDVNDNDPDGRIIYIHGDGCVIRCDVVRARLINVQLRKAIAAATAATGASAGAPRAGDPGRLSIKQRNYILVLCSELGITQRAFRLGMISDVVKREVVTMNDLTGDEAGRVIDYLQEMTRRATRVGACADVVEPF
jgi:hypothetical protein